MTSGASATNSAACLRMSSASPRAPAGVDPHVAAVGPAQLLQPLQECRDAGLPFRIVRGTWHEHADAPHPLGLLRARRKRPRRRCAAESVMNSRRLMFAPRLTRIIVSAHISILKKRVKLYRIFAAANVRFGSFATFARRWHVRFAPKSDHGADVPKSTLCATSGFGTAATQNLYSITSSARASSVGGTVRPSALAVLRLRTSSNLTGRSTGKSAGLSPLRILST